MTAQMSWPIWRAPLEPIGPDDSKLLPTKASHEVAGARDHVLRGLSDLFEANVAAQMTIGVVEGLDRSASMSRRGRGLRSRMARRHSVIRYFLETAAVRQSGERVGDSQNFGSVVGIGELLLCELALSDLTDVIQNSRGHAVTGSRMVRRLDSVQT